MSPHHRNSLGRSGKTFELKNRNLAGVEQKENEQRGDVIERVGSSQMGLLGPGEFGFHPNFTRQSLEELKQDIRLVSLKITVRMLEN